MPHVVDPGSLITDTSALNAIRSNAASPTYKALIEHVFEGDGANIEELLKLNVATKLKVKNDMCKFITDIQLPSLSGMDYDDYYRKQSIAKIQVRSFLNAITSISMTLGDIIPPEGDSLLKQKMNELKIQHKKVLDRQRDQVMRDPMAFLSTIPDQDLSSLVGLGATRVVPHIDYAFLYHKDVKDKAGFDAYIKKINEEKKDVKGCIKAIKIMTCAFEKGQFSQDEIDALEKRDVDEDVLKDGTYNKREKRTMLYFTHKEDKDRIDCVKKLISCYVNVDFDLSKIPAGLKFMIDDAIAKRKEINKRSYRDRPSVQRAPQATAAQAPTVGGRRKRMRV